MLTWRELAAGSLAVGQLVEYVAAAGSSAARQVPRAPMIAGAVVGLVLFSAIVSTPVWPAEITLQGSLHGRGRMQLPGTVTDLQEGDARTDIRHDASLDLRGSGLRIRLRTRDSTWAGCGLLRTPGGGSILVGHLDLQWAAGCLFVSCEGSDLSRDIRSARNETLPLRARGTTAWRQDPQSGVVLQQRFRSLHLGTWRLERNLGFALALGPWAGAVDRAYTFQGNRWNWSSVLAWPPVPVVPGVVESVDPRAAGKATATGMTPSNRVLLELSGRFARSSSSGVVDRLGGHWRIGLTPVLGALSGAFRYGGLDHRAMAGAGRLGSVVDEGCFVDWIIPVLRGVTPRLSLSSLRKASRRTAVPTLERDARLALASEPWPGVALTVSFTGTRALRCRSDPSDPERMALILSSTQVLDLQARFRISPAIEWTLRCRESSGELTLSDEEVPQGLAPLLRASVLEESVPEDDSTTRWWDRGTGGIIWVRLRWHNPGAWEGGATLAATPEEGRGTSAVPVRIPPGRSFWYTMGAGRWFIGLWAGRKGPGWRVEGAVRLLSGRSDDAPRLAVLLGIRRRIPF